MADLLVNYSRGAKNDAAGDGSTGQKTRIKGVFSTLVQGTVGFGHTKKRTRQAINMYVEELEEDRFSVQPLNSNFVPAGAIKFVTREELFTNFLPEPDLYMERVMPAIRNLGSTIERGEQHYQKGETFSAEYEFKSALRVDEENIRATFGLGLTYLDRGDRDKGELVFKRLARLKNPFEDKHKHLFNEFGIKLRKNKLYVQALKHYARAYKLTRKDEHLLYNIARTLYEKGNLLASERFCKKALAIRPQFTEAKELLDIVTRRRNKAKEIRLDF